MPVISDRSFKFRVNVTRTNRGFAQQNYGLFHDLSVMPPGWPRDAVLEFCNVKFGH